jgi:hypothetical protein
MEPFGLGTLSRWRCCVSDPGHPSIPGHVAFLSVPAACAHPPHPYPTVLTGTFCLHRVQDAPLVESIGGRKRRKSRLSLLSIPWARLYIMSSAQKTIDSQN